MCVTNTYILSQHSLEQLQHFPGQTSQRLSPNNIHRSADQKGRLQTDLLEGSGGQSPAGKRTSIFCSVRLSCAKYCTLTSVFLKRLEYSLVLLDLISVITFVSGLASKRIKTPGSSILDSRLHNPGKILDPGPEPWIPGPGSWTQNPGSKDPGFRTQVL
jgi:hypothetical protein